LDLFATITKTLKKFDKKKMTLLQKLALIQIQENRSFKYLLLSLTFILEPNDKTPDFSQSPGHLPQKPSPFTHFYLNFHLSLTFSLLLAAHFAE